MTDDTKITRDGDKFFKITETRIEIDPIDLAAKLDELQRAKQNAIASYDEQIAQVQRLIDQTK